MKIEKPTTEPSMDEILASIRHIISGDAQDGDKNHLVLPDHDDILDLTNALPEEGQKMDEKKEDPKPKSSFPKEPSEKTKDTTHTHQPTFSEPLVSQSAVSEAARSFQTLNKVASESPRYADPRLNAGIGGLTVENLVREALRPLLKEWLDANLPTLVQWVVNEQVERIVRQNAVQSETASVKDKSTGRHSGI